MLADHCKDSFSS